MHAVMVGLVGCGGICPFGFGVVCGCSDSGFRSGSVLSMLARSLELSMSKSASIGFSR